MKIREQTDQSKQKDDMKNWTSEKITDQIQRQWLDALKTKSNYDRLLEMEIPAWILIQQWTYSLENFSIDFPLVERLKKTFPNIIMENIYYLYENKDIDKIDWGKVEKCNELGIICWDCKIFLQDTDVDFDRLEELKNIWVQLSEYDILTKRWEVKKNKEQILKNIKEIKEKLSIVPEDFEELSQDFLFHSLWLDYHSLQQLQQQWRTVNYKLLQILNYKSIYPKRWKMLQGLCSIDEMINYNNMSMDGFLEKFSSLISYMKQ